VAALLFPSLQWLPNLLLLFGNLAFSRFAGLRL
jgi:hypothetical protein